MARGPQVLEKCHGSLLTVGDDEVPFSDCTDHVLLCFKHTMKMSSDTQKGQSAVRVVHLAEELLLLGILEHQLSDALDSEHGRSSTWLYMFRFALENLHGRALPEHLAKAEGQKEILRTE